MLRLCTLAVMKEDFTKGVHSQRSGLSAIPHRYEVYFPPITATSTVNDGGWKVLRPSWCSKPPSGGGGGYKFHPLSAEYTLRHSRDPAGLGLP